MKRGTTAQLQPATVAHSFRDESLHSGVRHFLASLGMGNANFCTVLQWALRPWSEVKCTVVISKCNAAASGVSGWVPGSEVHLSCGGHGRWMQLGACGCLGWGLGLGPSGWGLQVAG